MSDVTTIEADVPERYADAVSARLRTAADEDVVGRMWRKDGTLWAPEGTPEVTNRLGWLDIAERSREQLARATRRCATSSSAEGYTDAIVLGMGGSSLAPGGLPAVLRAAGRRPDAARAGLDAPGRGPEVPRQLDLDKTLDDRVLEVRRDDRADVDVQGVHARASTARTSSPSPTRARRWRRSPASSGFRRVFYGDPDIGGRYSALSAFGLVPAAVAGFDVAGVLDSAIGAAEECRGEQGNAGLWLGCALGELALPGPRQAHVRRRRPAELLRRLGRAARRRVDRQARPRHPADRRRAAARPEAYGDDRVFLHIALDDADNAAALAALKDAGHPVITIRALGPADLGRIFFLSEFAVAVAGWVLEINPFDQPNVQEAKDNTNRVLKEGSQRPRRGQPERADGGSRTAGVLRDHGLPAVLRRDRGRRRPCCARR